MYSWFDYEDLEVVDMNGLKKYIKENMKRDEAFLKDLIQKDEGGEEYVTMQHTDGWKIISYWYSEFVAMLRDIAAFVDGSVHWSFENSDEGGYITMDNGHLTIHFGVMRWEEVDGDAFLEQRSNNNKKTYPLSETVKAARFMRGL